MQTVEAPLAAMAPGFFGVADIWDETDDTFTLTLHGWERPFGPGQFNMLSVFGIGEVPISISGDPAVASPLVHTVRGVGAVTKALRNARPGDLVGVRGPFGTGWPVDEAVGRDVVFVAGGIGLAPLRPAIYHVLRYREQFDRVVVMYGVRSPRDIIYGDLLTEWRGRFDLDVLVTVDTADRRWRGSVGVVTKLIGRAPFDPHRAVAFVCGPEVMMKYTALALHDRGVTTDRTYVSMERNMKCGLGLCGHCQYGPSFVCREGPVYRFDRVAPIFDVREV